MANQVDFSLPEFQDGNFQVNLAPPTNISGWTIQFDTLYRFNSPQPIYSIYLASGYANGQSGATLVDGTVGSFIVGLHQPPISGVSQHTAALAYQCRGTDSGQATPLNFGYRLLTPD